MRHRTSRRRVVRRLLVVVAALATVGTACVTNNNTGGTNNAPSPVPSGSTIPPKIPQEPTSPVTVTFASWVGSSPQFKKFAKDFHALHPNITIEFQNVPAERATDKLTTEIAGGNAPDTAYIDSSAVSDFATRGALVNLDQYIAGSKNIDLKDFVPGFLSSAQVSGSTFGIPFDGETTALFYRTDLFAAAGLTAGPTTWDEMQADAAKLTIPSKKQYGFIEFGPESAYYWYPFLWGAGGNLISDDGKTLEFDSQQGQQAADFYIGLAKYSPPDYYNSNSWDGRVAFATGKVAMYEAGSWFGGEMESSFPKINGKWDVVPIPRGPARCATTQAGDTLVEFSQSKNQDAAYLWLDYLASETNMKTWTFGSKTTTLLPPRKSLLADPDLGKFNPWLKGFADQMSCAVVSNINQPKWPEIEQQLTTDLGKAIYGDLTPQAALQEAATKGQQIIASSSP
ncbi:MAG TPA: sugar ABC transporter substrate-binding protein [Actinomycetota bacterium]|nr:sugar ABC transporter substrate-binding protein [Actinomycetota bacterium]